MERAVTVFTPPGAVSGPANFIRRRRPSPDIALLGLYEISKILNGAARLDQMLGNLVNVLTSFLDMRLGMIVILDAEGEPEIIATAGWASEANGRPIETLPRAVIDRLVATGTPVVAEDVAHDPLFVRAAGLIASRIEARSSFLGVPIKADEKVIGTLSIVRAWDEENAGGFDADLSFLKMVANLVGQTVRLHRMLRPSASDSSTSGARWRRRSTSSWRRRAPRCRRSAASSARARRSAR